MLKKKYSLPFLGFLQATALVAYITAVTTFMQVVLTERFDDSDEVYAPIIMLLLFIISAVISGGIVLGKAGMLFTQRKRAEAYRLVGWTVGWGIVYFGLFVVLLATL